MFPYSTTKVTLELRELIESGVDPWDFEYDGYYEGEEKTAFEKKVIDHFYFRQIGQETVGRFLHYFRSRIREVMPYYKSLYKSIQLMESIENPFGNVDITETFEEETEGTSTGSSSGTSTSSSSATSEDSSQNDRTYGSERDVGINGTNTVSSERRFSNTPMGSISNLDNYLTEATKETNSDTQTNSTVEHNTGSEGVTASSESTATSSGTASTSGESSDTSTGKTKRTIHREGNHGVNTYAHDMLEYRQILLNIDMLVINELNDLFLMVY